jgi:Dolichyl-phosphate-mannose-protein mannosyltransferase
VPLCGALLVVATYSLGRRLCGAGPALAATALVACSPVVVFESLVVMADVPAAAFWISALAVALQRTGVSTLGAGVLSGIAILTRPNLLPLAVFPWLLAVCRVPDVKAAGVRTALFASGKTCLQRDGRAGLGTSAGREPQGGRRVFPGRVSCAGANC